MPLKYTPIELWQVKPLLQARGYGFNGTRAYALQLNKAHPSEVYRMTGTPKRVLLGGINHATLERILMRSETATEAADQIEQLCLGKRLEPSFGSDHANASIDTDTIEQIARNRADNLVAQRTAAQAEMIAKLHEEVERLKLERAAQAEPKKPKRGRPKGSKNGGKAGESTEIALTDEQEELLRKLNFGPQMSGE